MGTYDEMDASEIEATEACSTTEAGQGRWARVGSAVDGRRAVVVVNSNQKGASNV